MISTAGIILVVLGTAMVDFPDTRNTVKIGNQVWMAENLNTGTFRNSEAIPQAVTTAEWIKAGKEGKPAWCYYENHPENGEKYGRLYNWFAVTDPRGLAPEGWHIASDTEWRETTDYLGGEDAAGTKLKKESGWVINGNGTNESGFSGLPGGSRNLNGNFSNMGNIGYWWTSTEENEELAWYRVIDKNPYYVYRTNYSKMNGFQSGV